MFANSVLFEEIAPEESSLKHWHCWKLTEALIDLSEHCLAINVLVKYRHSLLVYQIAASHQ